MARTTRYSAKNFTNLHILLKNPAETLMSRKKCCWIYVESILENTLKKLVVQKRVQLEHSSHIVKVSVKATC